VDLVGEANVAAWVSRLDHRLSPEQVEEVFSVLDQDFPPHVEKAVRPVQVPPARVVLPLPKRPAQPEALFDVQELTDSILESVLRDPIEAWMTFLHPDQLKLVSATWGGPARVRGPAGTGKTVVGLHRAAYLAERSPKKVLFVTFVRTLPIVLAGLCERMSPTARANIEFTGLHRLAIDIVERAGSRVHISGAKIRTAFAGAWLAVGWSSPLSRLDDRPSYWQEEIDHVIKGRGLTHFGQYADLQRLGRRTPMRAEHREAMWRLYVEYERRLDRMGVDDFTDALIAARDLVRAGAVDLDYGAVVVDEVQDLNLVGVQLLHAIAGDGPNGLLVIGDGQQSVYPGGFTLSEAGISVTGRAAVLRTNYRNTAEVLETAERVVAQDSFDDIEGVRSSGRREVEVRRTGGTALTVRARDARSLDVALTAQIQDAGGRLGVPMGDMAVLVQTRADLEHYAGVLARAGLPHGDLLDYDGLSNDRIKVGTFKRAKGLEFKYVLLPGLREGPPPIWPGESPDAYLERAERMRRELYVGMTRARDGLWLGYLDDERLP
jgi:superfamily I DNA/RNA helicase